MKRIVFILLLISNPIFSQIKNNKIWVGLNTSSMGYDYSNIGLNIQTYSKFNNSRIGTNIGYGHEKKITNNFFAGLGIEYINLRNQVSRPQYYNNPIFSYGTINEELCFTRLQLPIILKFKFPIDKNKFSIQSGVNLIFFEHAKRDIIYNIPFPTNDSTANLSKTQKLKFGENSSLGSSLFFGMGYEFKIKKNCFEINLNYFTDLSKSRLNTLENIEDESFYFIKFKSLEFKLGYLF